MKKLTFILLILIMVSCTSYRPSYSILESTCKLPCWNGLFIGKSTMEETLGLLKSLPVVDKKRITIIGHAWSYSDDGMYFKVNNFIDASARFSNDKLVTLSFLGNLNTSISRFISEFGEPTYEITSHGRRRNEVIVNLIYPLRGIGISFSLFHNNLGEGWDFSPDTQIDYLIYFSPDLFEKLLVTGTFSSGFPYNNQDKAMNPWIGYGNVEEKYPIWNP